MSSYAVSDNFPVIQISNRPLDAQDIRDQEEADFASLECFLDTPSDAFRLDQLLKV